MPAQVKEQRHGQSRKAEIDHPHHGTFLPADKPHAKSHNTGKGKNVIEKDDFVFGLLLIFSSGSIKRQ